jgi:hypothetical protein
MTPKGEPRQRRFMDGRKPLHLKDPVTIGLVPPSPER